MNKPFIKPYHIDGFLVMAISGCGFWMNYLDSPESYKYVTPFLRFWTIGWVGFGNSIFGALLFFRNKAMSEHAADMRQALKEMDITKEPLQTAPDALKPPQTDKPL